MDLAILLFLLLTAAVVIGAAFAYWKIALVLAAVGLVAYMIRREGNLRRKVAAEREAEILEKEHQTKIENMPHLDLIRMNESYDRLCPTATHVDLVYVEGTMLPALAGKPIQGNEFERRAFERNRHGNVERIRSTIYHLEVFVGFFALNDYDFEAGYFPVHMKLGIHRGQQNPWAIDLNFPGWESPDEAYPRHLKARLLVADIAAAEHLRKYLPSLESVFIVFRPVEALYTGGRHGINTLALDCELLGIRLLAARGKPFLQL